MNLTSSIFIFLFFPLILSLYYFLGRLHNQKIQNSLLIAASLFFCGYVNIWYAVILLISASVNYICAAGFVKSNGRKTKIYMASGILFNLFLLGYFKYYNFFVSSLNECFQTDIGLKNIILPLGISFFTFQQLAFLMDVSKGDALPDDFWDYLLFVAFFPKLISGPLVAYREFVPQIREKRNRDFQADHMAGGIYLFVIGLFKKVVIADSLVMWVNNGYAMNSFGFAAAWVLSLSYTFQIYFDFSGYSDMARGISYMFNIKLPVNFNSPYQAAGIKEFWARWHITLNRVLSRIIYIPLGGNRRGKFKSGINLLITFLASGLWHGAAWTFVTWGLLHGTVSVIGRLGNSFFVKLPRALRVTATFLFVNAAWVFFRADTFSKAVKIMKGMLDITRIELSQIEIIAYDGIFTYPLSFNILLIAVVFAVLFYIVFKKKNSNQMLEEFKPGPKTLVGAVILFGVCIVHLSRLSTFIYLGF